MSHARWDYEEENPLRDARGFKMAREVADASQLTDDDVGLANVILTNGARLYVDHAHPEYSSPEVTDARATPAVGQGRRTRHGDCCQRAANDPWRAPPQPLQEQHRQQGRVLRHPRELSDANAARRSLRSCATSRPSSSLGRSSAARVASASGNKGRDAGFQISQRADFFEVEVGLETTLKRPIINTRDEPHADAEKYRRLHVIIGDANLAEVAGFLKIGTTSLVLVDDRGGFLADDLAVSRPVHELHAGVA